MKIIIFIITSYLLFLSGRSYAAATQPEDISKYLKEADDCQYLSGEWDSIIPKERQLKIEKEIRTICGKAKASQKNLRSKYKNRNDILKIVNVYDFNDGL